MELDERVRQHALEVIEKGYTVVPGAVPAEVCARAIDAFRRFDRANAEIFAENREPGGHCPRIVNLHCALPELLPLFVRNPVGLQVQDVLFGAPTALYSSLFYEVPDGLTTADRNDVRRLRRDVRVLGEEQELPRKAAAWFAKETRRARPGIRAREAAPGPTIYCNRHHVTRARVTMSGKSDARKTPTTAEREISRARTSAGDLERTPVRRSP
jgi:hypothetical protein